MCICNNKNNLKFVSLYKNPYQSKIFEVGPTAAARMDLPMGEDRRQMLAPFSVFFHLCCHTILPVFQGCLPVSNKLTKKTLHRCTQQLGVWLVPDVVKLTLKMNHNTRGIPKQLGLGKRKWQWESKVHRDREQRSSSHRGGGGCKAQQAVLEQMH